MHPKICSLIYKILIVLQFNNYFTHNDKIYFKNIFKKL